MRIDLHTHSRHSDGSDSPTELVQRAAGLGLDVVALTDHDTVAGWDEALTAGERYGVLVVPGVEISTSDGDSGQHLLGYNFDPALPAVAAILARGATARADRLARLLSHLGQIGLGVDGDYVRSLADGVPSRKHVAAGMVHAGHVSSEDEAFAKYLRPGAPGYVPRKCPTTAEAITAIGAAGGVSVLAHPRDGDRGPGVSEARFRELAALGLDGVEVDHPKHSPEIRAELHSIAASIGLVVTGSSDYHGTNKVDHDLGCNSTDVEMAQQLLGAGFRRSD